MAEPILIYGKSGSGKSRSIKTFGENEVFVVNVIGKRLPFKSKIKTCTTDDVNKIKKSLTYAATNTTVKSIVIDDAGYLLTNQFMRGHSADKTGGASFKLYNDIADSFWRLLVFIKNDLPNDMLVYLMMHEDSNDYGEVKLRTIGKLLSEKVSIEGMCTVALRCMVEGDRHCFKTNSDANDISKSPEGMFPSLYIDNDLKAVDTAIRDYYGLSETTETSNTMEENTND